jgi:hypothetical protein
MARLATQSHPDLKDGVGARKWSKGLNKIPVGSLPDLHVEVRARPKKLVLLLFLSAAALWPSFPQARIAIVNASVIDGMDHLLRRNVAVIIEGNKIVSTQRHSGR